MQKQSFWLVGQKIDRIPFSSDIDLITIETPPQTDGPPPHYHADFEEFFLVLEGELTFWIGNEKVVKGAGEYATMPKNTIHTFANKSDKPAKSFNIHMTNGFVDFMASAGVDANLPNAAELSVKPENIQKMVHGAEANDMRIVMPKQEA